MVGQLDGQHKQTHNVKSHKGLGDGLGWSQFGVMVIIGQAELTDVIVSSAFDAFKYSRWVEGQGSLNSLDSRFWTLSAGCINLTPSDSAVSGIICLTNRGCRLRLW